MHKLVFSKKFVKSSQKLPDRQQEKLAELLEVLKDDPFDQKLHTKALSGNLSGLFSFRITREYRVVFRFLSPESIQLLRAAHRKDVYRS